ncbi:MULTISPECIES: ankyrin repeat domain-containing protein [Pacificimonas]|nr:MULTISPECIES: ankyrin repeat domain-containing protein [Pacificimonas]MBZ6377645.1 ankyrin repeat domain-containing protein [Pacificimonas aurantium]
MTPGERFKMTGRLVLALCAFAAMFGTALPAQAQFSDRFEFFEAVRKEDGAAVIEFLDKPGQTFVNAREPKTGKTALHIVTENQELGWINLLQKRGASVDLQDDEGNTPLLIASNMNFVDGVRLLLFYGADPNLANRRGETPLIRAVQRRDHEMVSVLLEAGADPDIRDNYAGFSARDYAERDRRATRILQMIESQEEGEEEAEVEGPGL